MLLQITFPSAYSILTTQIQRTSNIATAHKRSLHMYRTLWMCIHFFKSYNSSPKSVLMWVYNLDKSRRRWHLIPVNSKYQALCSWRRPRFFSPQFHLFLLLVNLTVFVVLRMRKLGCAICTCNEFYRAYGDMLRIKRASLWVVFSRDCKCTCKSQTLKTYPRPSGTNGALIQVIDHISILSGSRERTLNNSFLISLSSCFPMTLYIKFWDMTDQRINK